MKRHPVDYASTVDLLHAKVRDGTATDQGRHAPVEPDAPVTHTNAVGGIARREGPAIQYRNLIDIFEGPR